MSPPGGLLEGKRLLITGVLSSSSIAFEVARQAQASGAEVMLTGHGRSRRITERASQSLDPEPRVVELDILSESDLAALSSEVGTQWPEVDGVLHAIAYAPPEALGGGFLETPRQAAETAFATSAYSLQALVRAVRPLLRPGASIVSLTFDGSVAWPSYDWMGVAKAGLEAVSRYLARDLGSGGVRVNSIAAGPLSTPAAQGIPEFRRMADAFAAWAPLGWDPEDRSTVADACCLLLSDLARGITGAILPVDGGFSAVGLPASSGRQVFSEGEQGRAR